MTDRRFYAVRLIWVRDPDGFSEYQERAKPILAKHGVHVERWLVTEKMEGEGIQRPDLIVVTWFKSAEAKAAFENDPDFVEVEKKFRDQAVKLVTITATSVFGDPQPD